MSSHKHSVSISFALTNCRCGSRRIAGITCPDCGQAPKAWEVDPKSQRRGRLAQRALLLLRAPIEAVPETASDSRLPYSAGAVLYDLSAWVGGFLSALQGAFGPRHEEGPLLEEIDSLMHLRRDIESAPRLRPSLLLIDTLVEIVGDLTNCAVEFLEAVQASTPLDAQQHGQRAQSLLDNSINPLKELEWQQFVWDSLEEEEEFSGRLGRFIMISLKRFNTVSPYEIESIGRDALRRDQDIACPEGFGFQYIILRTLAEAQLDRDKFSLTLKGFLDVFLFEDSNLRQLAAEPNFLRDVREAYLLIFDGWQNASSAIEKSQNSRQALRALLSVAHMQFEGPGQVLAAAVLRVSGRKVRTWDRLRQDDATQLVEAVASWNPSLMDWAEKDVRTSVSHQTYRIEAETIVFEVRAGSREIGTDEFIDSLLSGFESTLAGMFALQISLARLGIDGGGIKLEDFGVSETSMAEIVLQVLGSQNPSVVEVDDTWRIEADASETTSPIALIGGTTASIPSHVHHVDAVIRTVDGTKRFAGPTGPLKDYSSTDDEELKELIFLELAAAWTVDGRPAINQDGIRKVISYKALQEIGKGFPECVSGVRQMISVSQRLGDEALVETLKSVIRFARIRSTDQAAAVGTDSIDQLTQWGAVQMSKDVFT